MLEEEKQRRVQYAKPSSNLLAKDKPRSKPLDFKHRNTEVLLLDCGWYNPAWIGKELRGGGLLQSSIRHRQVDRIPAHGELVKESFLLVASLKNCAKKKDLDEGSRLHAQIRTTGLLVKHTYLGSTLISMYAKCGALFKAQEVFHELPLQSTCTWNALLSAYAQQGLGKEVLDCFYQMRIEGLSPDAFTYACTFKACGIAKEVDLGKQIHAEIVSQGLLDKDVVLGSAMVDMYAKCGVVSRAQESLDELPVRDVVAWNGLIAGYARDGKIEKAMVCYEQMRCEGLSQNARTYTCILKACGIAKEIEKGKQIHEEIASQGLLEKPSVLGTALVDMYVKCGMLSKARQVLDKLPIRDVELWNAFIAGHAQQEQSKIAILCYDQMRCEGCSPNAITYACILKACAIAKDVDKGQQIHEEIAIQGLLEDDIVLGTALVDMYAKCGKLIKARQVLDGLPSRNVVSWNALIAAYAKQEQSEDAMACYDHMRHEGISPNAITYACTLKACAIAKEIAKGEQIHEEIASKGLLGKDVVLGNALVDMYANCGVLIKARQVLDELPIRDIVVWSALIAGYTQHGQGEEAISCYEQMRHEGLFPNGITYTCVLKACDIVKDVDKGKQIHEQIASDSLLGRDVVLDNALVDMYAKCGALANAQEVFDKLLVRDALSWNSLIAGYVQQGQVEQAMICYDQMRHQGLSPNTKTYACILKACGIAKEADKAKDIHKEIASQGLLEKDAVIGNALVDMYAKCGMFTEARTMLDELPVRDVISWSGLVAGYSQEGWGEEAQDCFERMQKEGHTPNLFSWTSLIEGYARQGESDKALDCFHGMQHKGIPPDETTLVCVLNVCSHSGLVDEGQMFLENMYEKLGITPNVQHHVCMVDLFGRTGNFDKAMAVIEKLPPSNDLGVWCALLGACRIWGNIKLGRLAFEHALQIDETDPSLYVCMENINVAASMQEKIE